LLIKIHRRMVFIHDKYIFSSILHYSILQDLLVYSMLIYRSEREQFNALKNLAIISGDPSVSEMLKKKFFERIDRSKLDRQRNIDISDVVEKSRLYPSIEYLIRAVPRQFLIQLINDNYVWIIPYADIRRISRKKIGGKDVLEILYKCPITEKYRVFRTVFDNDLYTLIHQLCMFNNNQYC